MRVFEAMCKKVGKQMLASVLGKPQPAFKLSQVFMKSCRCNQQGLLHLHT